MTWTLIGTAGRLHGCLSGRKQFKRPKIFYFLKIPSRNQNSTSSNNTCNTLISVRKLKQGIIIFDTATLPAFFSISVFVLFLRQSPGAHIHVVGGGAVPGPQKRGQVFLHSHQGRECPRNSSQSPGMQINFPPFSFFLILPLDEKTASM